MARRRKRSEGAVDPATRAFARATAEVAAHPLFAPLALRAAISRHPQSRCPDDGWAIVFGNGTIEAHPTRRAEVDEWKFVLGHCLLHLGLEQIVEREDQRLWNAACDCAVTRFLLAARFGRPPETMRPLPELPNLDEGRLYERFRTLGLPPELANLGTAGRRNDMIVLPDTGLPRWLPGHQRSWAACLAEGISEAVSQSLEVAAGELDCLSAPKRARSNAQRAKGWFMSSYPLLGALAESFRIVEDSQVCQRMAITIAAVDMEAKEIYVNPAAGLSFEEAKFVLAHELLHVGLRHDVRRRGREAHLWNVACDYVINGWLIEMRIGSIPAFGLLHDAELKGLSAESIYDRIAGDLRTYRKLATLRGVGRGDMLEPRTPEWWQRATGVTLDQFYRECMARGLTYHDAQGRGLLPSGLIEEIRALEQPAIPWDVELARWFDGHFAPIEMRRTFARPSRRQSSTPDIPRPRWAPIEGAEDGRTFAVVIDTSGSMDRVLLGRALGAVASYAVSRDVPRVRVVFCDATAYDEGYLDPESIAGRVKVRGRGGTILQPGVDLVERAPDFPPSGPILVITDGACDVIRIRRDHAYLLPEGRSLPFAPKGPVFRMR